MSRVEEIETRLSAIASEIETDGADVKALAEETDSLMEERQKLLDEIEVRKATLAKVAALPKEEVKPIIEEETKMEEKRTFAVDSAEYREAWLKNLQGKELTIEERDAMTASSAIPTETMNMIVGKLELNPIIAAVDVSYIPGNVTFPAEDTINDANWVEMATAATDSADALKAVTLGAYKLIKTVSITADVQAMAIPAFEAWLTARLANKIEKAVDAAILTGNGSNKATGILQTLTTADGTWASAGLVWKDIATIIGKLKSEYRRDASFVMDSNLFFGSIVGMVDTNKQPVVRLADAEGPTSYRLVGYPVIVDDNCTSDHILFGDLKAYKFNFAKAPEVKSDDSVEFRTGSRVYRAMALADGKLADTNAIVHYKKA